MFIRLEDFSKCMGSKANAVFLHSFVLGSRFLGEIFQLQRVCVFLDAKDHADPAELCRPAAF